jgi:hypothetical protein
MLNIDIPVPVLDMTCSDPVTMRGMAMRHLQVKHSSSFQTDR